jgi:hypothetical protein
MAGMVISARAATVFATAGPPPAMNAQRRLQPQETCPYNADLFLPHFAPEGLPPSLPLTLAASALALLFAFPRLAPS